LPSDPRAVAQQVAGLLAARPATLGAGRLLVVDGPAGSGKTTLAAAVAGAVAGSAVVHTDEMLHGWRGLPGLAGSVEALLRPLAAGRPGRWTRWDWYADDWAETHEVPPTPLLVVEGTGSWSPPVADLVTVLVWVEAPSGVRLDRGMARDGEQMRPQWERWRLDEDALHGRLRTRDHADVVVETGADPGSDGARP
jgi:uridine kinase